MRDNSWSRTLRVNHTNTLTGNKTPRRNRFLLQRDKRFGFGSRKMTDDKLVQLNVIKRVTGNNEINVQLHFKQKLGG